MAQPPSAVNSWYLTGAPSKRSRTDAVTGGLRNFISNCHPERLVSGAKDLAFSDTTIEALTTDYLPPPSPAPN